jgi:release factor glutamine methyltransferase
MSNSLRQHLQAAVAQLRAAGSPSPSADAEHLLMHLLGRDRAWLRTHDDASLSSAEAERFAQMLQRRQQGEPVAYIVGGQGFWSLDLQVDRHTLIPRADTELLVEIALGLLPCESQAQVLDLGTGSGAIALAVKKERPSVRMMATDASPDALRVAQANAERLHLAVEYRLSDWFSALAGERFDVVLSNPPYIAENDAHLGQGDLRFEPLSALVAGEAGMRDIRRIGEAAPAHLTPGGWLAVEHGWQQGAAVRALLAAQGFREVVTHRDLGGQERVTRGCY